MGTVDLMLAEINENPPTDIWTKDEPPYEFSEIKMNLY